MTVAIVDYGSGNLRSAAKAFERAAREAGTRRARAGDRRSRTRSPPPTASCCRASAPSPTAAPACTACRAWSSPAARGHRARQAVPRHLRRHAAHGHARRRVRRPCRARLDRGRRGADRARQGPSQDPAHGLERAAGARSRTRCWRASRRTTTPISCIPSSSRRAKPETLLATPSMAARSPPSSAGTISPARSSIPRRARRTGLRLIANFLRWKP